MKRGGETFHQPGPPWYKFGLNMDNLFHLRKEKFNNGFIPPHGWLDSNGNPNEWPVAYHGIREFTGNYLGRIIIEGLKPGEN